MSRRAPAYALLAAALSPALGGCYLWHQAIGQLEIAWGSEPVAGLLEGDRLTPERKDRLRLIDEICSFGVDRIGLVRGSNYTRYYDPERDYISYAVGVAQPDRLEPVTWWFPIVGRVSYKGFFDLEYAREEAADWREEGYDVYLRGVRAYSTLGWFSDPVLPWMLDEPVGPLAETMLHELCHGRVYVAGETDFNESLASFVGWESACEWAAERYGADSPERRQLDLDREDQERADVFFRGLCGRLKAAYAACVTREERLARKEELIAAAREEYRGLPWNDPDCAGYADREWNHALLLANLTYGDYDDFVRLFEAKGRAWPAFWEVVDDVADADDPWEALRAAAGEGGR